MASHKVCGEENSATDKCIQDWLSDAWPKVQQGYANNDILNADETGLFFKLIPEKLFHLRTKVLW